MSDEDRDTTPEAERQDRRGGEDRRRSGERRESDRGIWNVPVLKRLIDRRQGGDRRGGADRRRS